MIMTYRVIRMFTDLQDNDYEYNAGDVFPRQGMMVTADRYAELASNHNKQGTPLIEAVDETSAEVAAEDTAEIETVNEPEDETAEDISDVDEKPRRRKRKGETE